MQVQIDFTGKKIKRITFACDEDLVDLLSSVARDLGGRDISELAREYVIECVTRDKGKLLLMKSRSDRSFVSMAQG